MSEQPGPYKGLMPFDDSERDALLFFGREREREIAVANLVASRLTVLYGPSGVGKSSLLRAGVAYELRGEARSNVEAVGRPELAVVVFAGWRDDPVRGLRAAIAGAVDELVGPDEGTPVDGEDLSGALAAAAERVGGELYVILDQFEEYFLYHGGEDGPGTLAAELPDAVSRAGAPVHFLIGMREDSLAKLDAFKGRIPNLFGNYLRLDRLDERAARAAILGPIEQLNRTAGNGSYGVEPSLVDAVVDQVATGRIDPGLAGRGVVDGKGESGRVEAPYLQLVLQRIWQVETAAGSHTLRLATLDRLGGAQRIVEDHLERALDGLTDAQKDVAARIFAHLVTPSGTKIAHSVGDLARYAAVDGAVLDGVVDALAAERILLPLAGTGPEGPRVEIFHDVLASAVLAWTARYEKEQALQEERRAARRRHRRLVLAMAVALAALAVTTAIAAYALAQRSQARTAAHSAQTAAREARARALDASALALLPTAPRRSLRLAVDSARLDPTAQAEGVLRQALLSSYERAVVRTRRPVSAAAFSPDGRRVLVASEDGTARILDAKTFRVLHVLPHRRAVASASYAPDGRTFVTASRDGAARLWDASTGSLLMTFRHAGPVASAAFGGGGLLATAGADHTARLWDRADGRLLHVLKHPGPVDAAVPNPAGTLVATVAEDADGHRQARLFDAHTGALLRAFPEKGVKGVLFSPDGRLLVTLSTDRTARIRDAATGELLRVLEHNGHVVGASFSADGTKLVTASEDGAAYVWDVASGDRDLLLVGPNGFVESAEFSPDGRFVVISSTDGTARVYGVSGSDTGRELADLIGHSGTVRGASFSPDGRSIVTAGADGTARLWRPGVEDELQRLPGRQAASSGTTAAFSRDGRLILVTGPGQSVARRAGARPVTLSRGTGAPFTTSALSPDGRLAATRDEDGAVHVWNVATGRRLRTLHGPARAGGVAFSPDGGSVLGWSFDGTARLWAARSGRVLHVLPTGAPVTHAAFSPDGRLVATVGTRGAAALWDARTGARRHELAGHRGWIAHVVFSPDGRLVLTAGRDATARVWSAATGRQLHELRGHSKALSDAEFSPDGRSIVTASHDDQARIWDVATGRKLHVLRGSFSGLGSASFSPDGRWVVAAARNVALLFHAADGGLVAYLRGHADRGPRGHAVWLTGASFAPDGHRILTASGDGTVRLYDCAVCGTLPDLVALAESRLGRLGR